MKGSIGRIEVEGVNFCLKTDEGSVNVGFFFNFYIHADIVNKNEIIRAVELECERRIIENMTLFDFRCEYDPYILINNIVEVHVSNSVEVGGFSFFKRTAKNRLYDFLRYYVRLILVPFYSYPPNKIDKKNIRALFKKCNCWVEVKCRNKFTRRA